MTARLAVVTGGSRGIGFGIAMRLAADGWALLVTARDADRLAAARAELLAAGAAGVRTVTADLAADAGVQAIVDAAVEWTDRVDALVLSAGVGTAGPVATLPVARYDKTFAVDVRAPFLLLQGMLPQLRAAAAANPALGARVVALASITGVHAEPGLAAYGAAKAALISLLETFNAEESVGGVSATAISPGYVDTDMSAWTRGTVPQDAMIPVDDIAELAAGLLRLSARSVIPNVVVGRAGGDGRRA
ncbi:SDR family NAD(P)-dependent oxidoreductase [Agromyces sp. MMS24-K17]|uniref:SDR family NAD(P)-dependent oxidoreductase n=1 Tax=Agromyces sp. MMS24-K17 TaxID=3372850 RepID=UPI0037549C43